MRDGAIVFWPTYFWLTWRCSEKSDPIWIRTSVSILFFHLGSRAHWWCKFSIDLDLLANILGNPILGNPIRVKK